MVVLHDGHLAQMILLLTQQNGNTDEDQITTNWKWFIQNKLDFGKHIIISCRALAWEGDYEMHPVRACVRACVCALVCHADFSKTATATDFL